jgi:two-component system, chemotaxis family, protein-glutamate methylesterase/glutaminase
LTEPTESNAQDGQREVVVIGASAGGVEALTKVIRTLPLELPAAVFVVLHLAPGGYSVLASILDRAGPMPASAAQDGEKFERGHIYVCPPDVHMLVVDGEINLTRGPRENGHRPAIDPLLRSVARAFGARAIGVILSGTLDDGTAGLAFLKARGGGAIVQDPDDALYSGMPASAIAHVDVDRVVPAGGVADAICALIDEPIPLMGAVGGTDDPISDPNEPDLVTMLPDETLIKEHGMATNLTCPECGGVLNLYENGSLMRFGCQVGHTYSPDSLFNGQAQSVESAMWAAIRTLEERADLLRRMARRSQQQHTFDRLEARAREAEREARTLHEAVARLGRAAPATEVIDEGAE